MKQTAVTWLISQIVEDQTIKAKSMTEWINIFEQAKAMEKEQIIDSWEDGQDSFSSRNAEQYYDETFKSK